MFDMTCKEKENDFEIKIAKATQKVEEKLTLMDIYERLNKLELENKFLKADKLELQKENIQLRNDNQVLHNILNENREYTTLVDSNEEDDDDLSYMDEYAKGNKELEEELAKAYSSSSDDFLFGGHDIKNI
jgi:hypothetical protein